MIGREKRIELEKGIWYNLFTAGISKDLAVSDKISRLLIAGVI